MTNHYAATAHSIDPRPCPDLKLRKIRGWKKVANLFTTEILAVLQP